MKSELWSEPLCVFSMEQAIWVGINEEPRFKYIPLHEAACGLTNGEASHMPFLLQVEASNGQVTWTRRHVVRIGTTSFPTITRNLIMFLSDKGECQEPFKLRMLSSILRPYIIHFCSSSILTCYYYTVGMFFCLDLSNYLFSIMPCSI